MITVPSPRRVGGGKYVDKFACMLRMGAIMYDCFHCCPGTWQSVILMRMPISIVVLLLRLLFCSYLLTAPICRLVPSETTANASLCYPHRPIHVKALTAQSLSLATPVYYLAKLLLDGCDKFNM